MSRGGQLLEAGGLAPGGGPVTLLPDLGQAEHVQHVQHVPGQRLSIEDGEAVQSMEVFIY